MIYSGELRRKFKKQAKQSIKGHFGALVGAMILASIPTILLSSAYQLYSMQYTENAYMPPSYFGVMLLYFICVLAVSSPLTLGLQHYYVCRARGQQCSPTIVFSYFESLHGWWSSVKLSLVILVRSLGWIALYMIVAVGCACLMAASAIQSVQSGSFTFPVVSNWGLVVLALVLILAAALFMSVKIQRYCAAYIFIIDEPNADTWELTGRGAALFRGHNWELFVFLMSFIGWWLIPSVLLIGVGAGAGFGVYMGGTIVPWVIGAIVMVIVEVICLLYATAYQELAFVNYVDALMVDYNERNQPQTGAASSAFQAPPASDDTDDSDDT